MSEPSQPRAALQRITTLRGPKFYRDGEDRARIMFIYTYDASTRIGPRDATEADALDNPEAYARFLREDQLTETQVGPPDKKTGLPTSLDPPPFRPLLVPADPPGMERREREIGPYERRRNEAWAAMPAKDKAAAKEAAGG